MIFWRTLKKHIRTNGAVTVWLVIGVIVCAYCISVMLGMATGQYQLATRSNTEASLTIDIEDADIHAEEISAYLNDLAKNGMVNVLYFTPLKEKDILIGWEGTKGRTWFPITSGRFFDASEQETGALVGFVSDNVDQTILNQGHFQIGEQSYSIIGMGWVIPWSFAAAKSALSTMDVFGEAYGEETRFYIIPFSRYQEEYRPRQVLAQFYYASYKDLKKYAQQIEDKFPSVRAYPPDSNSDDVLKDNQLRYGILATLLCLIAGVTVIRLMAEWIRTYQNDVHVLWLCGMSRRRCMLLVYGHWAIYYCAGSLAALGLQYLTFPLLKFVYGNAFPMTTTLIGILGMMFVLSILFTIKAMRTMLTLHAKEAVV